jgi:EF hand domain-containing protein
MLMHKLTLKATFAGSVLALSFSALANAGDGAERAEPKGTSARAAVAKLDQNKDGKVTRPEAQAAGKQLFDKLDKDKNGELTRAEADAGAIAMHKEDLAASFKERDKNKDKRLSAEEADMPKAVFEHLDTNKDNALSRDEFQTRPDFRAAGRAQQFEGADKNKDGKITRAEATDAVNARFDKADTNHDGVITHAEFEERVQHVRADHARAPSNTPAK